MPDGSPEPPGHLSTGARQEWFRLLKWLMQVHGLLSPTDHAAIGIYCSYYDQWQQAEADIPVLKKKLATARGKQRGQVLALLNTAMGERNKARKEMRPYLSELGITPAARSRIRVENGQLGLPGLGDGKTESPLERAERLAGA